VASVDGIRGWSRLVAAIAGQAILPTVAEMHRAISAGVFRWLGPPGRPVWHFHDRMVGHAYGVTGVAMRSAGELGAIVAPYLGQAEVETSRAALKARAIAHGVLAEELLRSSPELDLEVTLRRAGRAITPDAASLRVAYPEASADLVVFVHGLVDSEDVWAPRAADESSLPALGDAVGATSLFIRYGSGRAIGRNGADLADLLEAVMRAWPVAVERIVVVGHSMGGLVARAACAIASDRQHVWLSALTDVVYLGTPHLGSWLEKATNVGGWVLRRASPHSAPIASLLEHRSRGIKDLRHGTLVEDAWGSTPVDALLSGLAEDLPWLEGVTHHLVVGRARPSAAHPLNTVFGDSLVRAGSARGTGRRRRIGEGGPVVITEVDASHTVLVRHPTVGALLTEVLGAGYA
jgi:pimeloyl-ACP methyl ester carboxylesterase